jgi:hypothetical protein
MDERLNEMGWMDVRLNEMEWLDVRLNENGTNRCKIKWEWNKWMKD